MNFSILNTGNSGLVDLKPTTSERSCPNRVVPERTSRRCGCVAIHCCCTALLANQLELEKSHSWLNPYDSDASVIRYFFTEVTSSSSMPMVEPEPSPMTASESTPIVQRIINIKEEEEPEPHSSAAAVEGMNFSDEFMRDVDMGDLGSLFSLLEGGTQNETTMPLLSPFMQRDLSSIKNEIEEDEELPPPPLERRSPGAPPVCVCPVCKKTFTYQARYLSHLQLCHGSLYADQPKCLNCDISFKTKADLRDHRFKHHDIELPFTCDTCGRKFRKDHHMRHHRNSHFHLEKYACQACGKPFGSLCSVKTHEKKATSCLKKIMLTMKN